MLVLLACTPAGEGDARDDRFLSPDGKDDAYGIVDGSGEALGVLRVANELALAALVDDVGLAERAAGAIVAVRLGDDELDETADDERFDSLAELDAVPYIGRIAFQKLLGYARDNGYVEGCFRRCEGETRVECERGEEQRTSCPQGCDAGQCRAFAISNVDPAYAEAVYLKFPNHASRFEVPPSAHATLDVATGNIVIDGVSRRQAGVGFSWSGIGFFRNADRGNHVLSVKGLHVGRDARLEIINSTMPLVLLSDGDVVIEGKLEVVPSIVAPAPGSGETTENDVCHDAPGPGGGGNGSPGCSGLPVTVIACSLGAFCKSVYTPCPCGDVIPGGKGGAALGTPSLIPLTGGGPAGSQRIGSRRCVPDPDEPGDVREIWMIDEVRAGGRGGGALQITARTRIVVGASPGTAGISAPGGAGAGGGAGGSILLEAPVVELRSRAVVAANGGSRSAAGELGVGRVGCGPGRDGAGGVGRIRINSSPGALVREPDSVVSPSPSFGELVVP